MQGISDDLMNYLSSLFSTSMPPEATAAQQKSYVTYTISSLSEIYPGNVPTITLLESRNLLTMSGITGFRTWEAVCQFSQERLMQLKVMTKHDS
jgi:hypothetical protein